MPQVVMTALGMLLYIFAIAADIFVIFLEHVSKGNNGNFSIKLNLVISAAALVVSAFLIFRTSKLNPFSKVNTDRDISAGISILRTYICMISLDIAVTLCLMPAGLAGFKGAKIAIMIFAPAFFLIGAVMYFVRAGKIGIDDFDEEIDEAFSDDEDDDF